MQKHLSKEANITRIYLSETKELWKIQKKNYTPKITCRITRKCLPYNNHNKRKYYLCLNKILEIPLKEGENLPNKKTELLFKCRNQNKFML